jgi:hypothetical protein
MLTIAQQDLEVKIKALDSINLQGISMNKFCLKMI